MRTVFTWFIRSSIPCLVTVKSAMFSLVMTFSYASCMSAFSFWSFSLSCSSSGLLYSIAAFWRIRLNSPMRF